MTFFTENDIWSFLKNELNIWEVGYVDSVTIRRAFQPSQNKTITDFLASIFQISNKRYGFQGSTDKFNTDLDQMEHFERYIYNKTLQISTQQLTEDTTVRTAGDAAESLASYLQSQAFIDRIVEQGIEILRITEVRHPHYETSSGQYRGDPSFDFVLSYTQEIMTVIDGITEVNGEVRAVESLPPP